jgi:hypothetical protein
VLLRKFPDAEAHHLYGLRLSPLLITNEMMFWTFLSLRLCFPPARAFSLAEAFGQLSVDRLFTEEPLQIDELDGILADFVGEQPLGLECVGGAFSWRALARGTACGTYSYVAAEQRPPRVDVAGVIRARTKVDITATLAARIAETIGPSDGIYRPAGDDEASDDPNGGDDHEDWDLDDDGWALDDGDDYWDDVDEDGDEDE